MRGTRIFVQFVFFFSVSVVLGYANYSVRSYRTNDPEQMVAIISTTSTIFTIKLFMEDWETNPPKALSKRFRL